MKAFLLKNSMILLVVAHGSADLLMLWWCLINPSRSMWGLALIAQSYAQACLVGSWAALSALQARYRIIGFLLGNVALTIVLSFIVRFEVELIYTLWGIAIACNLLCLAYRHNFGSLVQSDQLPLKQLARRWQFSIRQLMLLTLVVSCCLAARGWIYSFITDPPDRGDYIYFILAALMITLGLISIWSVLTINSAVIRFLVTLGIAGLLMEFFARLLPFRSWEVSAILILRETAILLGSLFVARRCRYRLVSYRQQSALQARLAATN